jgi:iron complex transport system substrate-binding protein
VVGGSFDAPTARATYARLGIAYVPLGIAPTVVASAAQVRALAARVGEPARGEMLARRIETALPAAPPARRYATLVWQGGGLIAGEGTLVAEAMARFGLDNAAAARGLAQGTALPLERLLADPPEVILVAARPHRTGQADRALAHPALRHVAGTRTFAIVPALLWCGGPTVPRLAARLAAIRAELDAR